MPRSEDKIQLKWPYWYHPDAPLGSADRYVASLSGCFNWVGIYILKGDYLELGPFLGEPTEQTEIPVGTGVCGAPSEWVVLIQDKKGKTLGQINIDSHTPAAFGPEVENRVRKVAEELGQCCSREDFINWKENESKSKKK